MMHQCFFFNFLFPFLLTTLLVTASAEEEYAR